MAWFKRQKKGVVTPTKEKKETPDGFWVKTPSGDIIETKELHDNKFVTPKEGHHTRIGSKEYFEIIFDDNKYKELNAELESADPLEFVDTKKYLDRVAASQKKSGLKDAVATAYGKTSGKNRFPLERVWHH